MNLPEQADNRSSEGYKNTFEGELDLLLLKLKNKGEKGSLPSSKKIGGLITTQMDTARLNTGMWTSQRTLIENFFNTLDDKYGNKLPVQIRIKNKVYKALGLAVVIDSHPSSKNRDQIEADLNAFFSVLTMEHGFRKKIAEILLFVMEEKFGFNATFDYGISEGGTEILNSEVNMPEFSD